MFNPEQTEAVQTARRAMEKAMRELRRLEGETIPAAEADVKVAEEVYRDAAAAAARNPSARAKLLEAETARDEARRRLDGLAHLGEVGKREGQKLAEEYTEGIQAAKQQEAMRLLAAAQGKFAEIAQRWNSFAASVRELVGIQRELNQLGSAGSTQTVSVMQQLVWWSHDRFCLDTIGAWDLPQEK